MKRNRRNAFSLLEVIAAVVILAVVAAATVATVAPMRAKSSEKLEEQDSANISAMAQTYFVENGRYPTSVRQLANDGYFNNTTTAEQQRVNTLNRTFTINRQTGEVTKR